MRRYANCILSRQARESIKYLNVLKQLMIKLINKTTYCFEAKYFCRKFYKYVGYTVLKFD